MPRTTASAIFTSSLPQRLGALRQYIVDAHRDKVDADGVMDTGQESNL
jgi:hypothetical protein